MKRLTVWLATIGALVMFVLTAFSQQQRRAVDTPAVYQIAGMEQIRPKREPYKTVEGETLNADLYQPPGTPEKSPVVVFANWKRKSMTEWKLMISWGQIVAASGLSAVIYQSATDPAADLDDVVNHLRKNATRLRVDEQRIAVFTMSGNTNTALPYFARSGHDYIRCAVIYYGWVIDNPPVRKDLPILIVRAGLESDADLNKRLENYARLLAEQNAPVTFVNYPEGHHSFDLVDDTDRSREIIKDTLAFLARHLRTGTRLKP